ncbi:YjbH domain-containing protein [Phocaeicola sp.]
MRKKIFLFVFMAMGLYAHTVHAQYMLGTTGMLNIPTADRQEPGTVMLGGNYLPEQVMPDRFGYNTGNYFVSISFFSFLELAYRETLMKSSYMSTKRKYKEQDRSYSIRLCVLKEGKYRPGVAFGANDPIADLGANTFQSYYGVVTKGFEFGGGHRLSASLGYYLKGDKNSNTKWYGNKYDGVFGGISYTPAFCKELKVMAEYDSDAVNVGAAVRLWKHLSIHVFTREFNCISAGMRYECTLIH